jgi:hypothetical protein
MTRYGPHAASISLYVVPSFIRSGGPFPCAKGDPRMLFKRIVGTFVLCTVLLLPVSAWAAHPLVTDDTGTQGKGKFQLEVNGRYDRERETVAGASVKTTGGQAATALSSGIADTADLVLGIPYLWSTVKNDGITTSDEQGISDTTLEVKWRFFEKEGFSFALKPGISFPTGDEDKGLGAGKTGYHIYLIGSKEAAPWAFHANLGYSRNENSEVVDELKDIWHASLAVTYEVIKNLKVAGDLGIERSPNKASDNDPAFMIGGIIYSVNKDLDLDAGVKYGLTSSETDFSLMAGTTIRF